MVNLIISHFFQTFHTLVWIYESFKARFVLTQFCIQQYFPATQCFRNIKNKLNGWSYTYIHIKMIYMHNIFSMFSEKCGRNEWVKHTIGNGLVFNYSLNQKLSGYRCICIIFFYFIFNENWENYYSCYMSYMRLVYIKAVLHDSRLKEFRYAWLLWMHGLNLYVAIVNLHTKQVSIIVSHFHKWKMFWRFS